MTVIELELPDDQAAKLKAQAQARGLTIGQWIAELSDHITPIPDQPIDERPIWEVIADNMKDVPAEEFETLPKDGASQIDYYLYGHPKR